MKLFGSRTKGFSGLHNSFMGQEANVVLGANGGARYDLSDKTLKPKGMKKPQSAAQHQAVEKAARVSAAKRQALL